MKTKINCLNCQKETWIENKEIKRGFGKFCSRKCSGAFNGAARPKPEANVTCGLCQRRFYMNETKKKNSKSGFYFCCRAHKDEAQRIGGIKEIMPAHYDVASKNTYRRIAYAVKPKKCERCSYDEHEAAIVVHHIDHNRQNNDISNLEVLCANCHAIEHWGEVDEG